MFDVQSSHNIVNRQLLGRRGGCLHQTTHMQAANGPMLSGQLVLRSLPAPLMIVMESRQAGKRYL